MHIATVWQIIVPLALLIDGTVSARTAGKDIIGTFQVYNVPECGQAGPQTKIYQLPNAECVDTPPSPDADAAFFSYRPKIADGVVAATCFLDVYPGKNCTGTYSGFEWPGAKSSQDNKCQNVLQGFTGLTETLGAKSVKFGCVKSFEIAESGSNA